MSHDIFISYSTANQEWAESALQLFESHGFSCWMAPRDIRPGSTWATEIVHGISNARVMLLLLSSASNQSRQVAREVQLADSSQLRIIPVLLEAVKPEGDFLYFLGNTQWLTALGGSAADHSSTLVAAVGEALNARPPKPETPIVAPEPALHFSPSNVEAPNAPPRLSESPPGPAPVTQATAFTSPGVTAVPLTGRPLFRLLLVGAAVVLVGAGLWFFRSSPKPEEQSNEPATAKPQTAVQPQPPSPALSGTWKGNVGTNAIVIQIDVQPGDHVVVLVDNQTAKTVREPAQVLVAHQGFLEMDMGQPPRARCRLRLSSDRRNLEGTWTQNKTKKTFNVVFAKAD